MIVCLSFLFRNIFCVAKNKSFLFKTVSCPAKGKARKRERKR